MQITLSREPLGVLYVLQKAGYEAYIVGGAVRDLLLGAERKEAAPASTATDYDCTTNATPEQIQALFPNHFYENMFGTVSVTPEHLREQLGLPAPTVPPQNIRTPRFIDLARASKIHQSLLAQTANLESSEDTPQELPAYEITTFRSDGVYTDHRRPDQVTWGSSLAEDLARRDFTINALALSVPFTFLETLFATPQSEYVTLTPDQYQLIDPHDGKTDLVAGTIRTVGDPEQRFREDALRMLRAIRFSVQLNMQIDEATYLAIGNHKELLAHVSFERIRDEFLKMLSSDYPAEAIELLDATGLLGHIIPELNSAKGVQQGGHHTTDVWTHSLDALACTPSPDPVVRLATLLHDIAKPETFQIISGQPTFYNHEVIGARTAKKIAQRLRLSNQDAERVFILVRNHMFHYQQEQTDAAIRRLMRSVGLENIDDILDLREGDRLGSGAKKTSWRLEELKARMIEQLNQPLDVTDLAINGHDLLTTFQLEPGPQIGAVLHSLFEAVLEDPALNTRETLLSRAAQALGRTDWPQSAE